MIRKDYFPTQDTPARVKDKVMQRISPWQKKFRLMHMMKYKFLVPVTALILIVIGGYIYLNNWENVLITWTNMADNQNKLYTQTAIETTNNNIEDLLQQKLAKAETILNEISDYSNKEEDITL